MHLYVSENITFSLQIYYFQSLLLILKCTSFSQGLQDFTFYCAIASIRRKKERLCFVLTVVNITQQIVKLSKQSSESDLFHRIIISITLQPVSERVCSSFELPDTHEHVRGPTPAWHDPGARGSQSSSSGACATPRSMCFWFWMFYCRTVFLPWSACSSMYKEHCPSVPTLGLSSAAPAGMRGFNSRPTSCHWPITALQWLLSVRMLIFSGTVLIDISLSAL